MTRDTLPLFALLGGLVLGPLAASPAAWAAEAGVQVPLADHPPPFRIYDVDKRERNMKRLLRVMAGTPALSHQAADTALGRLDRIRRREDALKARNGGRMSVAIIRSVDAELNAMSRRLGLREPAY